MTTSFNHTNIPDDRQLPEGERTMGKRLFRSDVNKIIGGVAGGMAEYLNTDPTIVRLLWVLIALFTGGAVIWVYLALWLFLPVGDNSRGKVSDSAIQLDERSMGVIAWILIAVGVLWLLSNLGILPVITHSLGGVMHLLGLVFWPLVLLAGGWLLLSKLGHTQSISQKVKQGIPEGDSVKESVRSSYRTVRERTPLKRSTDDRMLLGVCAGIANWLNIDPAVVRILWALFSLASLGTGVVLYVILAIIMPEAEGSDAIETVEGEVLDPVTTPTSVE
jgi:phage shock protein PspC (stress-responsive transcriptional regulator)